MSAGNERHDGQDQSSLRRYYNELRASESIHVKKKSEGELCVETGITIVTKQQGKTLFNVGYHRANRLHLHPEEASCLAHRGVLDIYVSTDGKRIPLTLREISDRLHVHVARECREVYCFLKDRKFIPRRHSAQIPRVSTPGSVSFAYEVHAPGKKTNMPLFHAIVCRMSDPMPPLDELIRLDTTGVPMKLFVCDGEGGVLCYEMKTQLETRNILG